MPKYHVLDNWDAGTNAPSQNFVYDFDRFRYCVNDSWREVLRHSANGEVISGVIDELVDAFASGCAIKLGVSNLCADLCDDPDSVLDDEVFVQGGSAYYYTDQKLFIIGSHPLVRVRPIVPMRYTSLGWDFGWLMVRSDGHVVYRRCDPYTLKFSDHVSHRAIRWFVLERRSSVGRMSPILAQPVATIAGPLRPFDQPTRDRAVFGHVERKPLRTLACARHFLDAMPDAAADAVHSAGDGP